jgi:hypothetical protein
MAELDENVRASCFAHLEILWAEFGEDIPYVGGLSRGFPFRGRRIPFLNYQKGIYRASLQRGPAALSINTSYRSPYADEATEDGFRYAYRAGAINHPDNRALRAAHSLQVPVVYFIGTRPGWYRPVFPSFITGDDSTTRFVVVTPGTMVGPLEGRSMNRSLSRWRIRLSDDTSCARRKHDYIRHAFVDEYYRRT